MILLMQLAYSWATNEPKDFYFREIKKSDSEGFEESKIANLTVYTNTATQEISLVDPCNPMIKQEDDSIRELAISILEMDFSRYTFSKNQLAVCLPKYMLDGGLTLGIMSKAISLLGISVLRSKYALIIGAALGAIKAYVNYKQKDKMIFCIKKTFIDQMDSQKNDMQQKLARGEENRKEVSTYNLKVLNINCEQIKAVSNEGRANIEDQYQLDEALEKLKEFYFIHPSSPKSKDGKDQEGSDLAPIIIPLGDRSFS